MVLKLKNRIIALFQLLLVLVYIVFEELIWEGIAKPIYEFIHALRVLQKVESLLNSVNAYVILVIFVLLLGFVEILGIYAGILFVSGNILLGMSLYMAKIPIAAFTFWIFRVTEHKLMQFGWFKWLYELMMKGIEWLKSRDIYQTMTAQLKRIKEGIKSLKERYFSKESTFMVKLKKIYKAVKRSISK